MPRVRYTAEGGTYRVGGHGFDPGEERDVDDELAEYLAGHDDFERVDGSDVSLDDELEGLIDEFDEGLWLDRDYQTRVDLVETGLFDSHLETITDVETSETVVDVVQKRRGKLED